MRSSNAVLLDIVKLLRDAPRTKTEISVLLDSDIAAVHRTVNNMQAKGLIEPVGLRRDLGAKRGSFATVFAWAKERE